MTLLQAYGIQFILNMKFWNGTQRIQCNEEKHNAGTPVPVKLWNKATCLVCQPEVWRETSEDNKKINLHKIFLFIL